MWTILQQTIVSNISHMFIVFSNNNDSDVLLWFKFSCKPISFSRCYTIGFIASTFASHVTNNTNCNDNNYRTNNRCWNHNITINKWKGTFILPTHLTNQCCQIFNLTPVMFLPRFFSLSFIFLFVSFVRRNKSKFYCMCLCVPVQLLWANAISSVLLNLSV